MAVIAGLERRRPRPGRSLAGHDLGQLNEDALARLRGRHAGIVLQAFHLLPTMTAIENVAVPLELARFSVPASVRATSSKRLAWGIA